MTDPVITDDEKDALLDGVATGEVEVQSFDGPRYAEVNDFVIPARSRIATSATHVWKNSIIALPIA